MLKLAGFCFPSRVMAGAFHADKCAHPAAVLVYPRRRRPINTGILELLTIRGVLAVTWGRPINKQQSKIKNLRKASSAEGWMRTPVADQGKGTAS